MRSNGIRHCVRTIGERYPEMSIRQLAILVELYHAGETGIDRPVLMKTLGLQGGPMTRHQHKLGAAGLVLWTEGDRSAYQMKRLFLTDQGRSLMDEIYKGED